MKKAALLILLALITGCSRDPEAQRDKYSASGQEYLDNGQYEEAIIEFRNALRLNQKHIPSLLGIAKAFQQTGAHQDAIAVYRQVIKEDSQNVQARLRIGDYLIAAGGNSPETFKQAQEMAEAVLAIKQDSVEARILLGKAYAGQDQIDNAIREYEKALSLDPDNLKATLNLAGAYFRKKEVSKAETTFKKALADHPNEISAHIAIAAFYDSNQRIQDVENHLKKAFDLNPADQRSLYSLSGFYLASKRIGDAENVFKEAIARKPEEREPRWGLATFYIQQGEIDKAAEALNELLEVLLEDSPSKLRLAEIYLDRKNENIAEEYIRSVLETNPQDAQAHFLLGSILRKRQEYDKALAEFDTAIKLNDLLAPAYLEKANLQLMKGDLDACETTLKTILQLNKNYLPARAAFAKLLAVLQKPEDALQQAQEVLNSLPNSEDALGARAEALLALKRLEESQKDWMKLCEMQPDNAFYWHRLGAVEAMQAQTDRALSHLRRAVRINPSMTAAMNDILYILLKENKFDEALKELDRLADNEFPQDETHRFRGQIYIAQGKPDAAEKEWRKAIELNPQNYQSYILLGQLKLRQNKLPEAIREVDQLIAENENLTAPFLLKAQYLQLSKNSHDAIENYRNVLKLDPENTVASNNLAWLLCETGTGLDEALSLAKKAKKKHPEDPEIADTLGWIHYKLNNYTLAADQLLLSVNNRKQPKASHYYRLGMALYEKGDRIQAKQALRKSLELNKNFDGATEAQRVLKILG